MLNLLGVISNFVSSIVDSFNRSNGSLGTTNTGQTWNSTKGTWSISSNKATSLDSATNYSLATVNLGTTNLSLSSDVTDGGIGLTFWVTDANNWFASSANYRTSSYSYSGCGGGSVSVTPGTGCNCGSYSCTYTKYCYRTVITGYTYTCPEGCIFDGYACYWDDGEGAPCGPPTVNPVYGLELCSATTLPCGIDTACASGCTTTSYGAQSASCSDSLTTYSGTRYYTELKLYKNVAGTVSTVATQELNNNTSGFSKVNSIKTIASGNTITVSGYSNTGLSSQLGSNLVSTVSGITKGNYVGIIKTPSDANQGSIIDNFNAQSII